MTCGVGKLVVHQPDLDDVVNATLRYDCFYSIQLISRAVYGFTMTLRRLSAM
jgi:hypothetical protein